MSYNTQSELAKDHGLLMRVAACAATQNIDRPEQWAWDHCWKLSAQAGWDTAYSYALTAVPPQMDMPSVGTREDVITDSMILSAVQAIVVAEATV